MKHVIRTGSVLARWGEKRVDEAGEGLYKIHLPGRRLRHRPLKYRASSIADKRLNAAAYDALRALTDRWHSGDELFSGPNGVEDRA
jgi:hypothetical protein